MWSWWNLRNQIQVCSLPKLRSLWKMWREVHTWPSVPENQVPQTRFFEAFRLYETESSKIIWSWWSKSFIQKLPLYFRHVSRLFRTKARRIMQGRFQGSIIFQGILSIQEKRTKVWAKACKRRKKSWREASRAEGCSKGRREECRGKKRIKESW